MINLTGLTYLLGFLQGEKAKDFNTDWENMTFEEAVESLYRDLKGAVENEEIRIVSGEANYEFWNHERVVSGLEYALRKRNAKIACIVGPAISVDEEEHNALLADALDQRIELYLSRRRMPTHYRVFGKRYAWVEKYHDPMQEKGRIGKYVLGKTHLGQLQIQRFEHDFDSKIHVMNYNKITRKDQAVLLRKNEIEYMNQLAKEKDSTFDDLDQAQILRLRERLGNKGHMVEA